MNIELNTLNLPSTGRVDVKIHLSADITISAVGARRRVSRLVISEIGNLLYGGEPSLVVGNRICWRVPILLAYPDTGPAGEAGALDVDVETGEIFVTPEQIADIQDHAHYLAQRTPPSAA